MSDYYWSPSTAAFYPAALYGSPTRQQPSETDPEQIVEVANPDSTLPADAMAVSTDVYNSALAAREQGKTVVAGSDGQPLITEPPQETLEQLAKRKRVEINAASVEALAAVRNEYPDYEQLSWERQEREALEGGGPLIESIANARGLEISELIDRILEKSTLYQQAAGNVIGRRQALEDLIAAALKNGDRDSIQSVSW